MNKPTFPILAALLLSVALAACSKTEQEQPAQMQPVEAPTAAPAPASTDGAENHDGHEHAEGEAHAEAPASNAPAAVPVTPSGPAPVEGVDYRRVGNGQPFAPEDGKIEVVEIFGYPCGHCAAFQPEVAAWKAQLPADVNFVYVPAAFGGEWDQFARAFYAAESLGLVERTHDAMYRAIHVERNLRGGADAISRFYAQTAGVDAGNFNNAMTSFAVSGRINRAKQFIQRSGVDSTPSIVIDGKYVVIGRDRLQIANHLIARERAAR